MSLSKPMLKRKNLDITQKKKIVYEYDRLISTGVKVNKAQFAQNHRLARSSLQTLLEPKNRELLTKAEVEGKDVEGRKRLRTSPYEYLNDCVQIWFKQMLGKNVPVNGETLKIKAIHIHWLIE